MTTVLISLMAIVLIAGIALAVRGWRGRRVGDHPYCRKCGFDLFGVVERTHCPECGADVTMPKAKRIGSRQRRRGMLGSGIAMTVIAAGMLVVLGTHVARSIPWIRYEPVWMLMRQGDVPALRELFARLGTGTLSDAQIDSIVDAALKAQGDPSRTWLVEWGDFIDSARAKGKVNDQRWKQYAMQSMTPTLQARPRVRRGDPVPFRVGYGPVRVGYRPSFEQTVVLISASLDGVLLAEFDPNPVYWGASSGRGSSPGVTQRAAIPPEALAKLTDGPNRLRIEVLVRHAEAGQRGNEVAQVFCEQKAPLTTALELVAADVSTVEGVRDESLRASVEKAVTLVDGIYSHRGEVNRVIRMTKNDGVRFDIMVKRSPVGLACDVILHDRAGHECPLPPITYPPNTSMGYSMDRTVDGFDADKVDVILRPDAGAAAETVDLFRIWADPIVLKDVPVTWEGGVARPSMMPEGQRKYDQRFWAAKARAAKTMPPMSSGRVATTTKAGK